MSNPPAPPPLPRSTLLTAFAWLVIGLSALGIPISVISGLMLIAGSYGTQNAEPLGAFTVLAGPTLTLVAGIGLLRRQRWGWWILVLVLGAIVVSNVWTMLAVKAGPSHFVSPEGVPTTVLQSGTVGLATIVVVSASSLGFLLTRRVRTECGVKAVRLSMAEIVPPALKGGARGWRVGHAGRDCMYYEERSDGAWQRLEINGEMLTGHAHHVIYFRSPKEWQGYPEWARHRREEIVGRIKSEFREPDYEYDDGSASLATTAPAASLSLPPLPQHAPQSASRNTQGLGALILYSAILVALGAGMSWLVHSGIESGETYFPTKRASQTRTISRVDEPAMFWISIGIYSAIGVGSAGFAAWLAKEAIRLRGRSRP